MRLNVPDDNAYHVVSATDEDIEVDNCVLDGFEVRHGSADGSGTDEMGGGIFIQEASPKIYNCTVTGNTTTSRGGGIMCLDTATPPEVRNCRITSNSATGEQGLGGGLDSNHSITVVNTLFHDNFAGKWGGGFSNEVDSAHFETITVDINLINCRLVDNHANYIGGGMYVKAAGAIFMTNCALNGNSVDDTESSNGGGMWMNFIDMTMTNCTLVNNTAVAGEGGGLAYYSPGSGAITNCLFYNNDAPTSSSDDMLFAVGSVTYTAALGLGGTTNIDTSTVNPLFADLDGANNSPGDLDDDLRLACGSPCINKGAPAAVSAFPDDEFDVDEDLDDDEATPDLGLGHRIIAPSTNTQKIDMGCAEAHGNAESECAYAAADVTQDDCINIDDLLAVINGWDGPGAPDIYPGCSGDGVVNIDDLLLVVNSWGECECAEAPGFSPLTAGDCWDTCSERYSEPEEIDLWMSCYDDCLNALCAQELIDCD